MKRLVLDFLARWWWMVALVILLAGLSAFGQPVIFTPAALICLLLDAGRGLFRVVRPLPLTSRAQAFTWWFIGVLLLPLLVLVPLVLGTQCYVWIHEIGATEAPWFYAAMNLWVGIGYGAFCFLLVMRLPTRPAVGVLEWIEQSIVGGLWGLSMAGLPLISMHFPKTPAAILPWHIALFVAVPVCVVLSVLAAPDMLRRRMFVVAARIKSLPSPQPAGSPSSGLTGIPLYLLTFVGRMLGVIALIVLFQLFFFNTIRGGKDAAVPLSHHVTTQVVMLSIMLSAIGIETIGLCGLRCLPLSTARLTILLLSMPWATGLGTAFFTAVWGGVGDPKVAIGLNFGAQMLALSGCGSLALAVMLHLNSRAGMFLLMLMAAVPAFSLQSLGKHPSLLAFAGFSAAGIAFWFIYQGLRKSNTVYQPRRAFGTTSGHPLGVR